MTTQWSIGSKWQRWDPHIHAPGTLRNDQFGDDWEGYLTAIEEADPAPAALGITDYFTMRTYERVVQFRSQGRLGGVEFVFPNIEIRLTIETKGRRGINLHLLVSPHDPDHVQRMKEKLSRLDFHYLGEPYPCSDDGLVRLGRAHAQNPHLPELAALREGANQFKVELSALRTLMDGDEWIRRNVLYAVAAGRDGLSGISEDASFHGQRQELGRLAHVIFSANPSDRSYWLGEHSSFLRDGHTPKPCLHGSDAHEVARVLMPDEGRRTWIRSQATFEGLRQTLAEPDRRVRIADLAPPAPSAANTICGVRVRGADWLTPAEMHFNDGLVTVIGARGSGKTALVDLIALAADASDASPGPASFIGRAENLLVGVEVEIEWGDGITQTRMLGDVPDEPRVQYLSQQFVERLSQANVTGRRLESDSLDEVTREAAVDELLEEIERVVFAEIPEQDRAGYHRFAELRRARIGAHLTDRADAREVIRERTRAIATDRSLRKNLSKLESGLRDAKRARDGFERELKKLPTNAPPAHFKLYTAAAERLRELQEAIAAEKRRTQAIEEIDAGIRHQLRVAADAHAALRERFGHVLQDDEWDLLMPAIADGGKTHLAALARASRDRASLLIEKGLASDGSNQEGSGLASLRTAFESAKKTLGEDKARAARRSDLERKLEAARLAEAEQSKTVKHAKRATERMTIAHAERLDAYRTIFETLDAEVCALEELYEPLRSRLADDKRLASLRFRVGRHVNLDTWVREGERRIFDLRKPPFQGRGSLRTTAETLDAKWRTGDASSVRDAVMRFGHDHVEPALGSLRSGVDEHDVGAWLFSTDHISIRYSIEFEETDLRNLSPGTRGVVLLMLFLAIDQSDERPLIIDQPEENLDPKSVFASLVPFFRDAAQRRQIIMVTHNANLVVNGDSDQVIVAHAAKHEGRVLPTMSYSSGGLEDPDTRALVCQYLEGGEDAFRKRGLRYGPTTSRASHQERRSG